MEVLQDRMSAGGIPVRWCMWCHAYITLDMHTNQSCHSFCRYCRSQIPHDVCRELGSNIISYTTRATQKYREDQGNHNPYERDIKAKQRPEQNLPADFQYTMVMPQRIEQPNAVRLMHTAPLNNWPKGWVRTYEIWSRPAPSATSTTTASRVTSATLSTTTTITATTTSVQQQRLQRATDP